MRWSALRCINSRTVPYCPKNKWILSPSQNAPKSGSCSSALQGRDSAVNAPKNWQSLDIPQWKKQMFALRRKFPTGWKPEKRLSREDMELLRQMRQENPSLTAKSLAQRFRISPEAVRRILKSKWRTGTSEVSSNSKVVNS